MKAKSVKRKYLTVSTVIIFIILLIYVVSILAMYIWAFGTSLKTNMQFNRDILSWPPGWPWEWQWGNFAQGMKELKVEVTLPSYRGDVYYPTMLLNSFLYTVFGALVNNMTLWVVAYLVTRFSRYKLSKILFTLNIALMTIPVIGNLPSALAIYKTLGWYDNYLFIIFNNIAFTGIYFLYFCAFIRGLGNEYYEAAYIDGAGNFTCMFKIAFPLTSTMFFVVLLLNAVVRWNDYMTMVIWMPNYPTLAYGIYKTSVARSSPLSFPPLQIAICVVLMLPILLVFLLFQDVFMGNLRLGALKG